MENKDYTPSSTTSISSNEAISRSLNRLQQWVEENEYKAYDPGDGQMSYLRAFTFGSQTLERVLTASVLRSPFNIRPLLGIKPHTSTKGMGYMAWGHLIQYQATKERHHADIARYCLDWLMNHRSPGFEDYCWGNEFTFTTRAGRIPRGEPTIVWSGLIGQAFVTGYELLAESNYLDVAKSTCNWILNLPREQTHSGTCLSYVPSKQLSIHNSNMLGGALLARVAPLADRHEFMDLARESMRYSCSRQNSDGAWFYGADPKYHWIDSFHTGYNLDSLKRYVDSAEDSEFSECLSAGYTYFKRSFFDQMGRTKYMHDSLMPIDIQCAAQAIDTLSFFSVIDSEALELAQRVAIWTITNMQSSDGYFIYRDIGWKKVRIPMFHWGQGTMFKALSGLYSALDAQPARLSNSQPGV